MSTLSDLWTVIRSLGQLKSLTRQVEELTMTSGQLVADLNAVTTKVNGIGAKVADLIAALADAENLPAEVTVALDALKAEVANVEAALPA